MSDREIIKQLELALVLYMIEQSKITRMIQHTELIIKILKRDSKEAHRLFKKDLFLIEGGKKCH